MNDMLTPLRARIDALDETIAEALLERCAVVREIGTLKEQVGKHLCAIRPGREARQLRHVTERFKNTAISPHAAAVLWRMIIGFSVSLEQKLHLRVLAEKGSDTLFWAAREYFGPFQPIRKVNSAGKVLADVLEQPGVIGILPYPLLEDPAPWWMAMAPAGEKKASIFACLPFILPDVTLSGERPLGFAVGQVEVEETGDDSTLLVLNTSHALSQSKLQTELEQQHFICEWLALHSGQALKRSHLVRVQGFLRAENAQLASLKERLAGQLESLYILGAYANPVILKNP